MRISDWSSDVCSSDLLGHKNTGTDGHAVVAIAHYPVHMPIAQLEELLRRAIAVVGEARLAQDRILKRDGKGGVRAAHAGSDLGVHVLRLRKGIQQPVRLSGAKLAPELTELLSGKEPCLGAVGGRGCIGRNVSKSQ